MTDTKIPKAFRFRIGTLHRAAQRLLGALQDTTIGPPVAARLSTTFVADFSAQIELVARRGTDQSGAFGTMNSLTRAQVAAQAELLRLAALARRAAHHAFRGEDSLLRSEFQVGLHNPGDLASVIERADRLLSACRKYPAELAPNGWSGVDSDIFSAAIDALADADQNQETAADLKAGFTAQRNAAANTLYKQCNLVQNAARMLYTGASTEDDPAMIEARARYLLDEFPPRLRTDGDPIPLPEAAPAPVAPPLAA